MFSRNIHRNVIEEGASISVLSSMTWHALGSPTLVLDSSQLLAFNRSTSKLLGVHRQMPITLGGKIVSIDVMVMKGPLEFNFILGHDYIYSMKVIVFTLFPVMNYPHNRNIVTVDQLSFITIWCTIEEITSTMI